MSRPVNDSLPLVDILMPAIEVCGSRGRDEDAVDNTTVATNAATAATATAHHRDRPPVRSAGDGGSSG